MLGGKNRHKMANNIWFLLNEVPDMVLNGFRDNT